MSTARESRIRLILTALAQVAALVLAVYPDVPSVARVASLILAGLAALGYAPISVRERVLREELRIDPAPTATKAEPAIHVESPPSGGAIDRARKAGGLVVLLCLWLALSGCQNIPSAAELEEPLLLQHDAFEAFLDYSACSDPAYQDEWMTLRSKLLDLQELMLDIARGEYDEEEVKDGEGD